MPKHWCRRSCHWSVLYRPTTPYISNTKKDVLFLMEDWDATVGSQKIPGITGKFGLGVQSEAGQRWTVLANTLAIANILFQQPKRWPYTWTAPDSQYWNQIENILCSQRWRSSIESAKTIWKLTGVKVMSYLLKTSALNWSIIMKKASGIDRIPVELF